MSDVTWLSYTELAERLGIGRQSARQLAIRRRWMRKPGNDGQARVGVPLEALTRPDAGKPTRPATRPEAGDDTRPEAPATPPATPPDETPALRAQVARLEERVDGLNRLLEEANRQRDELRAERDQWHVQADRLALALAVPKAEPRRSWWPFRRAN